MSVKRIRRILKWIFILVLSLTIIGSFWNIVCKKLEKDELKDAYGKRVHIDGADMIVSDKGKEEKGIPIILLPGWGSASPVLEFEPLQEKLLEHHHIITIEPLGYGLSGGAVTERSIENIVDELHQCVKKLGEEQYYLMGHSISGLYALYWSNRYPEEVKGVIGIDPSVPRMSDKENNPFPVSVTTLNKISAYLQKTMNIVGITRFRSLIEPRKVLCADLDYSYTDNELEIFRKLTIDRAYNRTVMKELSCMESNLEKVKNMKIPSDIPILQFISKENCKMMPQWEKLHQDIIAQDGTGKMLLLEGAHYLHFEQLDRIAEETITWISAIENNAYK